MKVLQMKQWLILGITWGIEGLMGGMVASLPTPTAALCAFLRERFYLTYLYSDEDNC